MKKIIAIISIIIVAIVVVILAQPKKNSVTPVTTEPATTTTDTTSVTSAPHETTNPSTTMPTPAPAPKPTPAAGTYTMAQIATHNDKTSCWTTIQGGVYDLTAWITEHPGGQKAILSLCGIDGTKRFDQMHGGQSRPEQELATFKIGILAQ